MIFRVVYLNQESGELGRLPDLAIINAGGVVGPTFTIGGKGVLLDDGTSSSGTGVGLTLQTIYDSSLTGVIGIVDSKPFIISDGTTNLLTVDSTAGTVSINGINFLDFYAEFSNHTHEAVEVSVAGPFNLLSGSNVEEVFQSVDALIENVATSDIKTFRYDQPVPTQSWIISHNKSSTNATVTLYDSTGEQMFADDIKIIDANTIQVSFNSLQSGFAVILLF